MNQAIYWMLLLSLCTGYACSSPANDRAIPLAELEKVQQAEAQNVPAAPARDALTAGELIKLAACADLPCVQFFMKDLSTDFVHARKGEFAALHRSTVTDTAGNELVMPLSTLYVDTNPQADWRLAHTLHRKELNDQLLAGFQQLGFKRFDSGYYRPVKSKQALFLSTSYPGITLYTYRTFQPWYLKGLYKKVTWPCFVFEIYTVRK